MDDNSKKTFKADRGLKSKLNLDLDLENLDNTYSKLEIPTIYECVLANEKLGFEIRKQNKEIKNLNSKFDKFEEKVLESFDTLLKKISTNHLEDCDESFEVDEALETLLDKEDVFAQKYKSEQKQNTNILMNTMDSVFNLLQATDQSMEQLVALLPKEDALWRTQSDKVIDSLGKGVNFIQEKLFSSLADFGLAIIEPKKGESFNPQEHRAVKRASGGVAGTIAEVIRPGFYQLDQVTRPADVVVYQ